VTTETQEGRSAESGERPESGFEINGERYELPRLDTINLDEERVLYIYSDTVLKDFRLPHPSWTPEEIAEYEAEQTSRIRNPDFKRALAHISYRRRHPEVSDSEIQITLGGANALEVDIALLRGDAEDPPSTNSQKQQPSNSESGEPTSSGDSGSPTRNGSDLADETLAATGTTESDTSSPGAPPIALVH
jgi:hypothetical protein